MVLVEKLPLALGALAAISLVVCAGTALQVATGVGLGLLAGPVLILNLESRPAIFVAIVLNLLVSLVLLPPERSDIHWRPLRLLMIGTLVGVPLGWLVLQRIDAHALRLFSGCVVLAAAVQLLMVRRQPPKDKPSPAGLGVLAGGGFSGFMAGCLAIPGPVAMWTLLQQGLAPALTRATLRASFVFSYGAAFLAHFGLGGGGAGPWDMVAALVPAVAVGIGLGVIAKRKLGEDSLHLALRLLLLAMGLSLLWKGIADVTA